MRQANGRKRLSADEKRRLEDGENIQPALVNSAVSNGHDPLPEGNWRDAVDEIRNQANKAKARTSAGYARDVELFAREFERRAKAMPFVRFVANGEDLPTEIGNVDKLQDIDGKGTWYMFPTSENLKNAFAGAYEDPTQGQEAQGGPLHGITGRGEKYAGGNIETDMVADRFKKSAADGKGSQTGGTGIQRATLGDASAIESAVEDHEAGNVPDQFRNQANEGDGHLRPLAPGTVIEQRAPRNHDEPGFIKRTTDVSKLHTKGGAFRVVKDPEARPAPAANVNRSDHKKSEPAPKPTKVDTSFADAMKEGEKTATDAAAAGAVTAGNSASDIEKDSPGIVGGFDGKQSEDASEGTTRDTLNPTVAKLTPGVDPYLDHDHNGRYGGSNKARDWTREDTDTIHRYLEDHGVQFSQGATRTDLEALATKQERFGGTKLARQKSDEATPQTAGGVLVGGANAKVEDDDSKSSRAAKTAPKKAATKKSNGSKATGSKANGKAPAKKGGVKLTGVKKPSTSKPANKPPAATHEEQKATEPGIVKGDDHTSTSNPPVEETKPEEPKTEDQ
jgi:hypothetical protein